MHLVATFIGTFGHMLVYTIIFTNMIKMQISKMPRSSINSHQKKK